jgi:aspartate/glutamate racemase
MTLYQKLFDLKYKKGIPTCELAHRFPEHVERVHEVALLDIPENTLREVVQEKKLFERLVSLKKQLWGTS